MKKHLVTAFVLVASCFLLQACSPSGSLIAHTRDNDFYNQFVNTSADWPQAESKIEELKVMQTGDEYPMRYVFFDNGRFYYQIDKLGNGDGVWSLQNGAIIATATRTIFDMQLAISAANDTGDATIVRFYDRHGFNSIPINFRNPEALKAKGKKVEHLRDYKRSEKNI